MAWILIVAFLAFIAPVRVGVAVQGKEGGLRGTVGLMIWGLRLRIGFMTARDSEGRLRFTAMFREKALSLPQRKRRPGAGKRLLARLLAPSGKDTNLRRVLRIRAMDVRLHLGGQDAAALALGTGFLRALGAALPFLRLRCFPSLGGKTEIYARCIVDARLGILLLALWQGAQRKEIGKA